MKKNPVERIMDAQLHLKMAREGPVGKCEQRIRKAERELRPFTEEI